MANSKAAIRQELLRREIARRQTGAPTSANLAPPPSSLPPAPEEMQPTPPPAVTEPIPAQPQPIDAPSGNLATDLLKGAPRVLAETGLTAAGLANQGLRGLGVGAQRLLQGEGGAKALDRASAATEPGFVPQKGERIGAIAGPALPMLATGNLLPAMAMAAAAGGGEKFNETGDLGEAAATGATDAAITAATGGLIKGGTGLAKMGIKAAQKSFGFTTNAIKRLGVKGVEDIAETLAKSKVIDPLGRRGATLQRVGDLLRTKGEEIGQILDVPNATTNVVSLAAKVRQKLTPKLKGPLMEKATQVADDVADTIQELGDDFVPLRKLHDLRKVIAEKAKFNSLTDTEASELFEKAYGVMSDALEEGANKVSTKMGAKLKALNKIYNAAKEGEAALTGRVASREAAEPGLGLGLGNLAKDVATSIPGIASRASQAPGIKQGLALVGALSRGLKRPGQASASALVKSLNGEE